MPFILFEPGARRNNKTFVVRVEVSGQRREKTTKFTTKSAARAFAIAMEQEMQAQAVPGAKEDITFRKAAELYVAQRDPVLDLVDVKTNLRARDREEATRISKLFTTELGNKYVRDINHADLVAAANKLYGNKTAQTKNREGMRPAAAILHYASENGYCPWLRVTLFPEPKPVTRAVTENAAEQLVNAAPEGMKRLLLLWLFRHGTRISQTLSVRWDNIDLQQQTFGFQNKKANGEWQEFPLHAEVLEMLAAIPESERHGRLWPWTQKTGVYRWLRPMCDELGIKFTPHMARHTVGKRLNAVGAGLKTIMSALGHLDPKSSIRYQSADIDTVRAAMQAAAKKISNG